MIKSLPTGPRTPAGAGPERPAKGRLHLLAAAERLFATQGLGVPNRDIIAAAGQRNRSAISYHFTSRAGLIDAVREQHEVPIAQHRQHLIARLPGPGDRTTRQLIEAHVQPVATEMLRCVPSYWARLSEMLLADQPLRFTRGGTPAPRPRPQQGAAPLSSGLSELMVAHLTHLMHLPEPEAIDRVALTIRFLNNGLACWERDSQEGAGSITPLAPFTLVLTDLAVAMLDAPSSVPTQPSSPVVSGQLRSAAVAPLITRRNLLDTGATTTFIEPFIQGTKMAAASLISSADGGTAGRLGRTGPGEDRSVRCRRTA